jgi:hypothetical protein
VWLVPEQNEDAIKFGEAMAEFLFRYALKAAVADGRFPFPPYLRAWALVRILRRITCSARYREQRPAWSAASLFVVLH